MEKLNLVIGKRGSFPLKKLSYNEVRKSIEISGLKYGESKATGILTIDQLKSDKHQAIFHLDYKTQTLTLEIQVGAIHKEIERKFWFYESIEHQIADILVEEKLTFLCLPVNMRHDWGGLWK